VFFPFFPICQFDMRTSKPVYICYRLTLQVMTLHPVCESVETSEGVPLYVTGVCQVKVMKDHELMVKATEQFLGKDRSEIETVVLQTVEGHLRAILGELCE